jgi:predicted DNA-binding transcriptional regulator AlpA
VNKQFIGQYVSDLQLAQRYGVSRCTIWRWTARGILPTPVKISGSCTRWKLEQIEQRDTEREQAA